MFFPKADGPLLQALSWLQGGRRILPFGLAPLDEALGGGLTDSTLVTIGGESEAAKSLLAQNLLWRWRLQGLPCIYLDFENGATRLAERFFAMGGYSDLRRRIPPNLDVDGGDGTYDLGLYQSVKDMVLDVCSGLYLPDPRVIHQPEDLLSGLESVRAAYPDVFVPLVVDSLQKLPMSMADRRAGLDGWLRVLEFAKQTLKLVVIATSEIPRAIVNEDDPFKDTTGIKYTSDAAFILRKRQGTLRIVKNRDGTPDDRNFRYAVEYPWVRVAAPNDEEESDG